MRKGDKIGILTSIVTLILLFLIEEVWHNWPYWTGYPSGFVAAALGMKVAQEYNKEEKDND